ncbi:unnamed protein product [Heterobilharzia americana]|nr:unnamed protein product [Heterobilharzia americana]
METVLKGVVAYIDVKSPFGNPAIALSRTLESLGASVAHTLNNHVTHVLFRNGSEAVRCWALKRNIPLVSPGWVKACKMMKVKACEAAYSEKEDKSDLSGVITRPFAKNVEEESCVKQSGPVVSGDERVDGLHIFKPIRVSEKFIRPKTPPEMKRFLLRIQRYQRMSEENTLLCEETVLENSKENIVQPSHAEKVTRELSIQPDVGVESLTTSTQDAINRPKLVGFRNSLSPIVNRPEKDILEADSILDDSLTENFPPTSVKKIPLNKFHLINPNAGSPLEELITPTTKQTSNLIVSTNSTKKLKRRSSVFTKKFSIGTPLTPDMLLNFVSSSKTSKSTVKKNIHSVEEKAKSSGDVLQKKKTGKTLKLFANKKVSKQLLNPHESRTPKVSSKLLLKKNKILCETNFIAKPTTSGNTHTPKRTVQSRKRVQSKNKVVEKPTQGKDVSLFPSLGDNQNEIPVKGRNLNEVLYSPSLRPVCFRLPVSVDLDATINLEQKSLSENKSIQTSIISSPIRKRLRTSRMNLHTELPYSIFERKSSVQVANTPLSMRPSRMSLSQIKVINKRNSLEEFRPTPIDQCKGAPIQSPSVSQTLMTRISIVFTGTQSNDEQVLIALLKSSNLVGYDIVKLPSHSLSSSSRSTRSKLRPSPANCSCSSVQYTHLVTESPFRRTLKLFRALIQGIHIVTTDWVRQSVTCNMWLPEAEFKPHGLPRLSRRQKMNKLFSGVGVVYVGPDTKPPRQDLVDLLNIGGAVLTNRKMEASILIGCTVPNKICIKANWILDCIFQAKLLSVMDYKM